MPSRAISITVLLLINIYLNRAFAFVHPGCLSDSRDLERMAIKVSAAQQPWKESWDILVNNTDSFLDDEPRAQTTVRAGGKLSENYILLARDCAKAYQCALRYNIDGNEVFADKAVSILNAWSATMSQWAGDTNVSLRAGLYGYQLACTAELMRDYPNWSESDISRFKKWLIELFYQKNHYFLTEHHGTCPDHYWANWDLANIASVMAIGVFCDNEKIFSEALDHFYNSSGNGAVSNAVHYIHPDGLGQWQESGRDQGHTTMGVPLMGTICEIAWKQGYDLYGYNNSRFLAGCEYIAKYNLGHEVPFVTYINCEYWINTSISPDGRGANRPGWEMVYNHYVNRKGIAAPYTQEYAGKVRPEAGGFSYGSNSGGFDQLGFTTLTHTLDQTDIRNAPSDIIIHITGTKLTLAWHGTAYAQSYNILRSNTTGKAYSTIATTGARDTYYTDSNLEPDTTYYYVIAAECEDGQKYLSSEISVQTKDQLTGTVIGSPGSYKNMGADIHLLFDGSLRNFFDADTTGQNKPAWGGLDLGQGNEAIITLVRYCPRTGMSQRMIGGKFQGSDSADFSRNVIDLFTITTPPVEGKFTDQKINNPAAFRYVRFLSTVRGNGNAAEIQFLGHKN